MIRKALLTIALMAGVSSYALAQNSTSPSTMRPAGSSSNTMSNSSNSAQMTEAQVKSKLVREGYSNISLKAAPSSSSNQPMWTGTATKGGRQVNIMVSFAELGSSATAAGQGAVTSTGKLPRDEIRPIAPQS